MPPFRSDVDALEARHAALAAEVAERIQARDEAARMLAEARARQRDEAIAADFATGGPARRQRRLVLAIVGTLTIALGIFASVRFSHYREARDREVRTERVMAQFEMFTDQMCACKDLACTQHVTDAMTRWATQMAKDDQSAKPDPKWMKKAMELGERMGACMSKLATAETAAANGQVELER